MESHGESQGVRKLRKINGNKTWLRGRALRRVKMIQETKGVKIVKGTQKESS